MVDLVEELAAIPSAVQRAEAVRPVPRDTLVATLRSYGFGKCATPTDWYNYYLTEELADFVLEYAEKECPAQEHFD